MNHQHPQARRVNLLIAIILLVIVATIGIVYAVTSLTVNTPGHVHINKGNKAGLTINPSTVEFGNVTAGESASVTLTLFNSGTCNENVTVSAIFNGTSTPMLPGPFTINPAQTVTLIAQYTSEMTLTMAPGDYSFQLEWTASCL